MKSAPVFDFAVALALAPQGLAAQNAPDRRAGREDRSVCRQDHDQARPRFGLGMDEGMTMNYKAQDPALLGAVKPGDKIRFGNGQYTVNRIEKVK